MKRACVSQGKIDIVTDDGRQFSIDEHTLVALTQRKIILEDTIMEAIRLIGSGFYWDARVVLKQAMGFGPSEGEEP